MTRNVRSMLSVFFSRLLLGLLVVMFALWGGADMLRPTGKGQIIAQAGDTPIYAEEYEASLRQLPRDMGGMYDPALFARFNIFEAKLQEMINRALLEQEVQRIGLTISEEMLAQTLSKDPNFVNANGAFDKSLFTNMLRQNQISEAEYLKNLRQTLGTKILLQGFGMSNEVSDTLLSAVYQRQYQRRVVRVLGMRSDEAGLPKAPDDQTLTAYYDTHHARYKAPAYRAISYVEITPSTSQEAQMSVQVNEQAIKQAYFDRREEFSIPAKRDIVQLVYSDLGKARYAHTLLIRGQSMQDVASSTKPLHGKIQHLGDVSPQALPESLRNPILSVRKPTILKPIKSAFGWHVIQVRSYTPSRVKPYVQVRSKIEQELLDRARASQQDALLENIEDAVYEQQSLEEIAKEFGLQIHSTDPIDRKGRKNDNSRGIPPHVASNLLKPAFTLQKGQMSDIISSENRYFLVRVDNIIPKRVRALEEVRGQVIADWQHEAQREQVLKKMQTIKDFSEHPKAITLHISRSGVDDKAISQKDRLIAQEWLTPALLDAAFNVQNPNDRTVVLPYRHGYAAVSLISVLPAELESKNAKDKLQALRQNLQQEQQNELLMQYVAALRKEYPVQVHAEILTRVRDEMMKTAKKTASPVPNSPLGNAP